jgi:hypothetical protein
MAYSNAPGRVIMRIELLPEAKTNLGVASDQRGMTQVATTSRVIEWFCKQDDVVQASILGLYPDDIRAELPTMIFKHMASEKKI